MKKKSVNNWHCNSYCFKEKNSVRGIHFFSSGDLLMLERIIHSKVLTLEESMKHEWCKVWYEERIAHHESLTLGRETKKNCPRVLLELDYIPILSISNLNCSNLFRISINASIELQKERCQTITQWIEGRTYIMISK